MVTHVTAFPLVFFDFWIFMIFNIYMSFAGMESFLLSILKQMKCKGVYSCRRFLSYKYAHR